MIDRARREYVMPPGQDRNERARANPIVSVSPGIPVRRPRARRFGHQICASPPRYCGAGWRNYADPDKARVMGWIDGLVPAGHAEWGVLGNGDVELRFMTGEVFRFSEELVIRVAGSLPHGQEKPHTRI
jgi:hypothetical protein